MTARAANSLGLLACAALLGYAYYAQYVLHLEPCPLCIFQRIGVFVIGIAFGLAAGVDPVSWGRKLYAAAIALAAGIYDRGSRRGANENQQSGRGAH